jgi:phage gpG-like protein
MPSRGRLTMKDLRARLEAFQGTARVSSADVRGDLIATSGAAIMRETLAGFRESRDPYGNPWVPVARGGKPLIKSGAMRASTTLAVTERGFEVAITDPVAKFHQFGTVRGRRARSARRSNRRRLTQLGGIRPRPMLPDNRRGMPARWTSIMARVSKTVLRRHSKAAA